MNNLSATEIEWLAAIVTPWAIAPHPNFSMKETTSVADLALVVLRRDYDRRRDETTREVDTSWRGDLVRAARDSLAANTQLDASETLWGLAFDAQVSLGARAAAAAFASLGLAEQERALLAAERLQLLATDMALLENDRQDNEFRLIHSFILCHLALRLCDSQQFAAARVAASAAEEPLLAIRGEWVETFAVSRGLSWKSNRVLRDILDALKSTVLRTKSYLEQLDGQTWVRAVRRRPTWVDLRSAWERDDRDSALLRDDFEAKFESTSGKRVIGRESTGDKAYAVLLQAELAGDHGRVATAREALGKIHLLYFDSEQFNVLEGLRLLRHAGAAGPLQFALDWVRNQGPTTALADDARAVLQRATRDGYATEADLLVLSSAADYLGRSELQAAHDVLAIFEKTEKISGRPDWSVRDKSLRALGRLLLGSERDNEVAVGLLGLLQSGEWRGPLSSTLRRLVSSINWESVELSTRSDVRDWAKSATGDSDAAEVREAVLTEFGDSSEARSVLTGMSLAAHVADADPAETSVSAMDEALRITIEALDAETAAARKGSYSFGGVMPLNVGVALALKNHDSRLWSRIAAQIADPQVDRVLKEDALDRLAAQADEVPHEVRRSLASLWPAMVRETTRHSFFAPNNFGVFPAGLRAGIAFGLLTESQLLEAVMELWSEGPDGRAEVTRTLPMVRGASSSWAATLLLQLSYDPHPVVRSDAAYALTQIDDPGTLIDLITARLKTALTVDGVRSPLRVLQGVYRSIGKRSWIAEALRGDVLLAASREFPHTVTDGARKVLDHLSESQGSK